MSQVRAMSGAHTLRTRMSEFDSILVELGFRNEDAFYQALFKNESIGEKLDSAIVEI